MKINHFSLFSGIGGLDLAAEWAGFETVGQVEIDDYCNKVLEKHWPNVPKWRDVFDLTGEEIKEKCGSISLLSGGFPCQPFSCAGKRRGKEDERYLWDEMLRIICEVRPRWVVAENVRGLFSIDAGRTFGAILRDLAENGYRVGWLCYGAGDVGAPHRRERVFIVGYFEGRQSWEQKAGNGRQNTHRRSKNVGNSEGARQPLCILGQGQIKHGRTSNGSRKGEERSTQPQLGNCLDGISAGVVGLNWPAGNWPTPTTQEVEHPKMELTETGRRKTKDGKNSHSVNLADMVKWPAGPGEQYEWEPPRIATGIKDRVKKLKALGNAVVPAQAYPIFKAIAETEVLNNETV